MRCEHRVKTFLNALLDVRTANNSWGVRHNRYDDPSPLHLKLLASKSLKKASLYRRVAGVTIASPLVVDWGGSGLRLLLT